MPVECEEADLQFHLHIVRSAKLQRLFELIENSKIETIVIFALAMSRNPTEVNYAKLVGIHKPVVQALLGKEADRATQAVWHHVDSVLEQIMKLTTTRREWRD
ncbi:MAG: FCD domain-containing protein [Acidobacteria bacterium]|nr:FCD domain-containing protein [Acidobacteriota bacterium]